MLWKGATVYLSIDLLVGKVLTKQKLVKALIGPILVQLIIIPSSIASGHNQVKVQLEA